MDVSMKIIAHARTDFLEKFGIPRQSGVCEGLYARIVFEPPYRDPSALRGIEGFSHLWLIWQFSALPEGSGFRPTVRPPRLGGNRREGVFATRSPFRPNPIGLSSVRLVRIEETESEGTVLVVEGADLLDGTPILDIKPYLPFTDAHPEAQGGFAAPLVGARLRVVCEAALLARLPLEKRNALLSVLAEDPRPAYQEDPARIYGFPFAAHEVKFRVAEGVLTVVDICPL